MKRNLLNSLIITIFMAFVIFVTGCSTNTTPEEQQQGEQVEQKAGDVNTIVDSHGRYVKVPKQINKIVTANSNITELIYALGAGDLVVGVLDSDNFPPNVNDMQRVGSFTQPSVETILQLNPDVVFAYGSWIKPELAEQIENAGIPLVYLDAYKHETMVNDISTLGLILDKKERAAEYASYIEKYRDLIEERTADLKPEEKVHVYWEGYGGYSTVSAGSGADEMIVGVAGLNIAAGEPVAYPKVSDEWILERDPQVVVKTLSSSKVKSGYGVTDTSEVENAWKALVDRPGWGKLSAVQNKKVYVLSSEITTSPRGSIVGVLYLAKWCYPELFKDIDPEAVNQEILKKFYGLENKGIWVYSGE